MAALRGWARSHSTPAKLAAVEQIIGYRFRSVERLHEALDLEKQTYTLPNGQERTGRRTRNTRLALVGDTAARFNFACQWYKKNLAGLQWVQIQNQGLCNANLGRVGFAMGLDELTVPRDTGSSYTMASTVEAILGAVYFDGGEEAVSRVMNRLGITHRLFDSPERKWVHKPVPSRRSLPARFFSGHQWDMQKLLFNINPSLLPRNVMGDVAGLPLNEALLRREVGEAQLPERTRAEEEANMEAQEADMEADDARHALNRSDFFFQKLAERRAWQAAASEAEEEKNLLEVEEANRNSAMEERKKADATSQTQGGTGAETGGEKKPKRTGKSENGTEKKSKEIKTQTERVGGREAKKQDAKKKAGKRAELESKTAKESSTVADPVTNSQETCPEDWHAIEHPPPVAQQSSLTRGQRRRRLQWASERIRALKAQKEEQKKERERLEREGMAPSETYNSMVADNQQRLKDARQKLHYIEMENRMANRRVKLQSLSRKGLIGEATSSSASGQKKVL